MIANLSVSFAVCGSSSEIRVPGALAEMGLKLLRMPEGASGLGSVHDVADAPRRAATRFVGLQGPCGGGPSCLPSESLKMGS